MNDKLLFVCYSLPLKDYLSALGIRYEIVGLSTTTQKMFWVYIRNDSLKKALDKWSESKI